MRRLLRCAGLVLVLAGRLCAQLPELLEAAMVDAGKEHDRWAYTETTIILAEATKKKRKEEANRITIVRFDPSKPYAEQYTPIQIKSKPPTPKDLAEYREKGERRAKRSGSGGGLSKAVELERIAIAEEDEASVTYDLPLKKGKFQGMPLDKFRLLIRVNKAQRRLETVMLRMRESMRMKLLVNLKGGEFNIDFTRLEPAFGPVMTALRGSAAFSFLFIKGNARFESTRTELKRVKPYNERFDVQIGPLKALDF